MKMKEVCEGICKCYVVVFSLLFWGVSLYDITFYGLREMSIPTILIFYFIYLISQILSFEFWRFMLSKNIHGVLKANIEKKFSYIFHGKAYHQESGDNGDYDYTTYKEDYPFLFKSASDCSVIYLDTKDIEKLRYIDLKIEQFVICADELTFNEEKRVFDKFSNDISKKDKQFTVERRVNIPGTSDRVSIYITNFCITFLDKFLYIIFIFLSFGLIYKCFLSCYTGKAKITIIKVISNHYDLTETDSFFKIKPVVKLFKEDIKFDRKKYAFTECKGLRVIVSDNNPLRKQLKLLIDNPKLNRILNQKNSFQLLENIEDDEANNKTENEEDNNKDNNIIDNKIVENSNTLETPFIA